MGDLGVPIPAGRHARSRAVGAERVYQTIDWWFRGYPLLGHGSIAPVRFILQPETLPSKCLFDTVGEGVNRLGRMVLETRGASEEKQAVATKECA